MALFSGVRNCIGTCIQNVFNRYSGYCNLCFLGLIIYYIFKYMRLNAVKNQNKRVAGLLLSLLIRLKCRNNADGEIFAKCKLRHSC